MNHFEQLEKNLQAQQHSHADAAASNHHQQ